MLAKYTVSKIAEFRHPNKFLPEGISSLDCLARMGFNKKVTKVTSSFLSRTLKVGGIYGTNIAVFSPAPLNTPESMLLNGNASANEDASQHNLRRELH